MHRMLEKAAQFIYEYTKPVLVICAVFSIKTGCQKILVIPQVLQYYHQAGRAEKKRVLT